MSASPSENVVFRKCEKTFLYVHMQYDGGEISSSIYTHPLCERMVNALVRLHMHVLADSSEPLPVAPMR